jgi:hypothetical protein
MDSGLAERIQALTVELSQSRIRPGEIGAGTIRRLNALNRELITLFQTEREYIPETGQRLPTARGAIIDSMIRHLARASGHPSFTPSKHEEAILTAVKILPESCERLQKLKQITVPPQVEKRFTKNELCEMTGYKNGRVNARLKAIGIETTGGGRPKKGDKPFSASQVHLLLTSIIDDDGAQKFIKDKCQESLKTL